MGYPSEKGEITMQHLTNSEYAKLAGTFAPKSPLWKDCLLAFVIGGAICVLGQAVMDLYGALGLDRELAGTATSVSLVLLSALLTGCHLYDKLGKHAGAGTLVPITGFANSVVSPALEFKSEGFVTGMAVKMFTIAGPVLVFGTVASVLYGLIYFVLQLIG